MPLRPNRLVKLFRNWRRFEDLEDCRTRLPQSRPRVETLEDRLAPALLNYYPAEGNANDFNILNNGTINGATFAAGKFGQAFSFDGVNDLVTISRQVSTDFTLAAWIKTSTATNGGGQFYNGHPVINAEVGGVTNDFGTAIINERFAFGVGNPDETFQGTTDVVDGAWHHVAGVRQGNTLRIYVDGVLEKTAVVTNSGPLNTSGIISIGGLSANNIWFPGLIDDVRIYNHPLTTPEVATLAGQTVIAEDFQGGVLPSLLEQKGPVVTFAAGKAVFNGPSDFSRTLLRTIDGGYFSKNFVAEVDVQTNGNISFFGMGEGQPTGGSNEPASPTINSRFHSPGIVGGRLDINDSDTGAFAFANIPSTGPHRLRYVWDTAAQTGQLFVDANYGGGAFNADFASPIVSGAANGFTGTNTHLFFGSADFVNFDNFQVLSSPALPPPPTSDFGDAPLSYGDAWHTATGPRFGAQRDSEAASQYSAGATGDDTNNTDDEDGITFGPLVQGGSTTFTFDVQNTVAGSTISGWVDWNADGIFGGGEQVIANGVGPGITNHMVAVPANAVPGQRIARFRLWSGGLVPPTGGPVSDGEVEDYAVTVTVPPDDYGDAPASYGDAFHTATGVRFGAARDTEASSKYSANATGDDTDATDDEDGVTFGLAAPGGTMLFTFDIQNTVAGSTITGWVDWNNNGTFENPSERVVANGVAPGIINHAVAVPANAVPGQRMARFRVWSGGLVSPTGGPVSNGEVEDYVVTVSVPTTVYVSPSFTSTGAAVDGDQTAGGAQPATVGYDAFATIGQALSVVATNGTAIVNTASYGEAVAVGKALTELRSYNATVLSLTVNAPSGLSGTFNASGAVTTNSPVLLLADVTVNAASATFNGTVNGAGGGGGGSYTMGSTALNFTDISATGVNLGLSDDVVSGALPIGFTFNFFGVDYTTTYVSSNGFLNFSGNLNSGCCSGQTLPGADGVDAAVAGFWNDLFPPGGGGQVYYQTIGAPGSRVFIASYEDIANCCNGTNAYTFQMKLYEGSNFIESHYINVNNDGSQASAGIENPAGTQGLQFFLGTGNIPGGTAVRYTPPGAGGNGNFLVTTTGTTTFNAAIGNIVAPLSVGATGSVINTASAASIKSAGGVSLAATTGDTTVLGAVNGTGISVLANANILINAPLTATPGFVTIASTGGGGAQTTGGTTISAATTVSVTGTTFVILGGAVTAGGAITLNGGVTQAVTMTSTGSSITANGTGVTLNGPVSAATTFSSTASNGDFLNNPAGTIGAGSTVGITANGNVSIFGIINAGTTTTILANKGAGSTIAINADVNGTAATATGGAGVDSITVNDTGTAPWTLNGAGGGDTFTINYGAFNAAIAIADAGASGTDKSFLNGNGSGEVFEINTATSGPSAATVGAQKVTYTGTLEQMTVNGQGGDDTYNVWFQNGPLPGTFTLADDTGEGNDIANLSGTVGADSFNVNTPVAQRVGLGSEGVNYTKFLETLNVFGKDEPGPSGDTFTAAADKFTFVNIFGGQPTYPTTPGDTLQLVVLGIADAKLSNPAIPNGSLTFTGGSHKAVTWQSIETVPVPLGMGGSFDMGTATSPVQNAFRQVTAADTFGGGPFAGIYGWQAAPSEFDRSTSPYWPVQSGPGYDPSVKLFADGHWGYNGTATFTVAVGAGQDSFVTLFFGDTYGHYFNLEVAFDGVVQGTVDAMAGELATFTRRYTTNGSGFINVSVTQPYPSTYWILNGLDVRPIGLVAPLSVARQDAMAGTVAVDADGLTVDNYTISGAQPNQLLTVTSGLLAATGPAFGTITNADQDLYMVGVQLQADAFGVVTFSLQRPTGSGPGVIHAAGAYGDATSNYDATVTDFTQTYQLPTSRRIDFDDVGSPTAIGFVGVEAGTTYTSPAADALGWFGTSASGFDRGTADAELRDGNWGFDGDPREFQVDLKTAGTYFVTVKMGDPSLARDQMEVTATLGTIVAPSDPTLSTPTGIGAPAGQTASVSFQVTTDASGSFRLRFDDLGGDSTWSIQGLEVRPTRAPLTLVLASPATVNADGTTIATYTGSGAAAGAVLSVGATLGAVTSVDGSGLYTGTQVVADGAGNFTFTVRSPASSSTVIGTVFASDVTGASAGTLAQTYTGVAGTPSTTAYRFDFDGGSVDTQAGFTSIRGGDLFNDAAGYGWAGGVAEFERSSANVQGASVKLYRDGAWGVGSSPSVFQVDVTTGGTGVARIYAGDTLASYSIEVQAEGAATWTAMTPFANTFHTAVISGSDANSDGRFEVRVRASHPTGYWVLNGIDVADTLANLPAAVQQTTGTLVTGRFDLGSGPVAAGFVGVGGGTVAAPTPGYGWASGVNDFDRGTASAVTKDLFRDAAWGFGTDAGVFRVATPAGGAAAARGYFGDFYAGWPSIEIQAEGGAWTPVGALNKDQYTSVPVNGSDVNGDGWFDIRVRSSDPSSYWVFNGVDVAADVGSLPTAAP